MGNNISLEGFVSMRDILNELSKEQLIHLVERLDHSMFLIGETCVEESKCHINSDDAVDKIRNNIYNIPFKYDAELMKKQIDIERGVCDGSILD